MRTPRKLVDEAQPITDEQYSFINIALVKSYTYTEEYNPYTGKTEPKRGAPYLKEGFVDGFLAGVAYRLSGD